MPYKSREKYNEYMRAYKQKRWADISLLFDLFRHASEFHVFVSESPLYIASMDTWGVEAFLKEAPKFGFDLSRMRHFQVKLVEGAR